MDGRLAAHTGRSYPFFGNYIFFAPVSTEVSSASQEAHLKRFQCGKTIEMTKHRANLQILSCFFNSTTDAFRKLPVSMGGVGGGGSCHENHWSTGSTGLPVVYLVSG